MIKGFEDINPEEWKKVIGGAIFVFGCLFVFLYLMWDLD